MQKEYPLISVVLPTYNRAFSIQKSIESVLGQTYSKLELIIVDDCSSDETEKIIKTIEDTRIRYIRNSENKGANYSRNKGIKIAKGEYIAFEDSDDIWHKDKLEKQLKMLKENSADLVYSYYNYISDGIRRVYPVNKDSYSKIEKNEKILDILLRGNIITTATIFVRKESLLQIGLFDEDMPRLQEWELCIRLAQKFKFICLEEPLTDVYFSMESITNRPELLIEAKSLIIRKHYQIMQKSDCLINFIYGLLDNIVTYSYDDEILNRYLLIFDNILKKQIIEKYGIRLKDLHKRVYEMFREKIYSEISMKWLKFYSNEKNLDDFFRVKRWNKIIIYGYGQLGQILYNLLKAFDDIEIVAILDKYIENDKNNELVNNMTDFINTRKEEIEKVDCIIITPLFAFSKIKEELLQYVNKPIIPLTQIFDV